MPRPSSIAGSLDYYRPRALRARSGRGLSRLIGTIAAPRGFTISLQIALEGGGAGGSFSTGTSAELPYTGNPATGTVYAICGHSVCDNANQVCGP